MAESARQPETFPPLTPAVFNILLALADGEKHGYAIMLEIEAKTNAGIPMGPGTLYGSIKRMLEAGLIEEGGERADPALDDQRRKYYRLSALGRRTLRAEVQRLESQLRLARAKHVLTTEAWGGR